MLVYLLKVPAILPELEKVGIIVPHLFGKIWEALFGLEVRCLFFLPACVYFSSMCVNLILSCFMIITGDEAVTKLPGIGILQGFAVGLMWRGFESANQQSWANRLAVFTNQARTKLFGRHLACLRTWKAPVNFEEKK